MILTKGLTMRKGSVSQNLAKLLHKFCRLQDSVNHVNILDLILTT